MSVLKPLEMHRLLINAALLSATFVMLGAPAPAAAQNGIPACQSAASDPDGDGWGWENSNTCVVSGSAADRAITVVTNYCSSRASDADGDGYGWENNRSCVVRPDAKITGFVSSLPLCQSANADSDGDGYGWENNASCVVNGTAAAIPALPTCFSANADPDGDGYGWENNASCIANGSNNSASNANTNNTASGNPSVGTGGTLNNTAQAIAEAIAAVEQNNAEEVAFKEVVEATKETNSTGSDNSGKIVAKLPADITDLILITGQSNTLGTNTTVDPNQDGPHPRVLAFTDQGWQMAELYQTWDQGGHPGVGDRDATDKIHNNFALHFAKRLVELDKNAVVGIVLVSEPGKGIRNWAAGAPGSVRVQQKALAAINSLPHKSALDGILWHQGETDWQLEGTSDQLAAQPAADDYYPSRFATVIENFRLENWFDRNTPFICGSTIKAFGVNQHLAALNSDNDDNTACVDAVGLPSIRVGGNHFTAGALRILGSRYADRYNLMR